MNGFELAPMVSRLTRGLRSPRLAIFCGLAVLSLMLIGLVSLVSRPRQGGCGVQGNVLPATFSDASASDRVRPQWPKYMPELPLAGGDASPLSPTASTITVAVTDGPPKTDTVPPAIVAGPELFAPAMQPVQAAKPLLQSAAPTAGGTRTLQTPPPQFLASQPAEPMPRPAMAMPVAGLPAPQAVRSDAMEKIAAQSDQQIRHGFELANRGAYFAARAEFTLALRLIAQGLDNDGNTAVHSHALSAALTAMKEAQDFIPAGGKIEGELDLAPIVAGHRTPVLKAVPPQQLQSMRALKHYFTFAQEQLALAAGQEVSASMALAALGKMHAALAGKPNAEIIAPEAKAIVFFQAAILVCPRNYMAANDLGVFLAHNGDFPGARRLLEHSVLVCRGAENLNNLSVVYRHLGEARLADLATEKARVAKAAEVARQKTANLSAGGAVEWVDPAALVQSPDQWADPPAKPPAAAGQRDPATANTPPSKPVVGIVPVPYGPATAR